MKKVEEGNEGKERVCESVSVRVCECVLRALGAWYGGRKSGRFLLIVFPRAPPTFRI